MDQGPDVAAERRGRGATTCVRNLRTVKKIQILAYCTYSTWGKTTEHAHGNEAFVSCKLFNHFSLLAAPFSKMAESLSYMYVYDRTPMVILVPRGAFLPNFKRFFFFFQICCGSEPGGSLVLMPLDFHLVTSQA